MWKSANRLYFESKKESKVNQNMNIETRSRNGVDKCYQSMKTMLKNLN